MGKIYKLILSLDLSFLLLLLIPGCSTHRSYTEDSSSMEYESKRKQTGVKYYIETDKFTKQPKIELSIKQQKVIEVKKYQIETKEEVYAPYNLFFELADVPFGLALVTPVMILGEPLSGFSGNIASAWLLCVNPFQNSREHSLRTEKRWVTLDPELIETTNEYGKKKRALPDVTVLVSGNGNKIQKVMTNKEGRIRIYLTDNEYLKVIAKLKNLKFTVFDNAEVSVSISEKLIKDLQKARPIIEITGIRQDPEKLAKTVFLLDKELLSSIGLALESSVLERNSNDKNFMTQYEKALRKILNQD